MIRKNSFPKLTTEWVGREEFLNDLTTDLNNSNIFITGIIGFGGEGKTTLTRKWIDITLERIEKSNSKPDNSNLKHNNIQGIFWYSFVMGKSIEDFFEDALKFFVTETDIYTNLSITLKSQILLAFLKEQSYIIILDGTEIFQHPETDDYGLFTNRDFAEFLRNFAKGNHSSYCIVSSRFPIIDLLDFSSYTQRMIKSLSYFESNLLLRKLGLNGNEEDFQRINKFWNGYALGISLMGSYLALENHGLLSNFQDHLELFIKEPHSTGRLFTVFEQYRTIFTDLQIDILYTLCVIRKPINKNGLRKVINFSNNDLQKLLSLRAIECDSEECFDVHSLIRTHYLQLLSNDEKKSLKIHKQLVSYYEPLLDTNPPDNPTLKQLSPAIEYVHHSCKIKDYERANKIRVDWINQGEAYVLAHQLGAYEKSLLVITDFFPDGDPHKEPLLASFKDRADLIGEVGFYLMGLGRLKEAIKFFKRHKSIAYENKDLNHFAISCINLSEVYAHTGQLDCSLHEAQEAVNTAQELNDLKLLRTAYARNGWALHLRYGDGDEAFQEAEKLEYSINSNYRFLYSSRGIQHADHLRKTSRLDKALEITEANLEICEENKWLDHVCQCHRVLGNIYEAKNEHDKAANHFNESLKNAQHTSRKDVLIRILLARGRWNAYQQNSKDAFLDLEEAFKFSEHRYYTIYEISIRIALSLAHIAQNELDLARSQLIFALDLSKQIGYFWGIKDSNIIFQKSNITSS